MEQKKRCWYKQRFTASAQKHKKSVMVTLNLYGIKRDPSAHTHPNQDMSHPGEEQHHDPPNVKRHSLMLCFSRDDFPYTEDCLLKDPKHPNDGPSRKFVAKNSQNKIFMDTLLNICDHNGQFYTPANSCYYSNCAGW